MSVRAVFIGMPGAGKTTVGGLVAKTLGVEFRDSDELIEERAGRSIPEIFATDGEKGFRAIEAETIKDALEGFDGVLSLGGGAVTTASTREILREYPVFLIDVDNDELVRRLTSSSIVRPLVAEDPSGRIATLRREREDLYRQCAHYTVTSDGRPARRVARKVLQILDNTSQTIIEVAGTPQGYDVVVGTKLATDLRVVCEPYSRILVAYAPEASAFANQAFDLLGADHTISGFEMPSGESAKSYETMIALWNELARIQLGRDGLILAIGGGAVTDSVGFAASTWLRGVPILNVPTTLLGMVDVAVGGKTGINVGHGRNLVGTFYSPVEVLVDLGHLDGLSRRQLRSGIGEIIKAGFIADRRILGTLECAGESVFDNSSDALRELIERSIRVKAEIVSRDEREAGAREVLNYGHTLAHAIESLDAEILHGEAVAIGCVFAAALAEAAGIAPEGWTLTHRAVFESVGLATTYEGKRPLLREAMNADKKVRENQLRFVVLSDVGLPQILRNPSEDQLAVAFEAVGL